MKSKRKTIAVISAILLAAWIGVILVFSPMIPKRDMTFTTMNILERQIHEFSSLHDRLPTSISELGPKAGWVQGTNDAWGQAIKYSVGPDGVVVLTSLGSDGEVGGEGDARDMVYRFPSKTADGHWQTVDKHGDLQRP